MAKRKNRPSCLAFAGACALATHPAWLDITWKAGCGVPMQSSFQLACLTLGRVRLAASVPSTLVTLRLFHTRGPSWL